VCAYGCPGGKGSGRVTCAPYPDGSPYPQAAKGKGAAGGAGGRARRWPGGGPGSPEQPRRWAGPRTVLTAATRLSSLQGLQHPMGKCLPGEGTGH
uniref:Uncharacterized protein n=1 Tax=Equus asinus asinus TaxID=83772 RepID=A0A8C4MNI6_EQUAS